MDKIQQSIDIMDTITNSMDEKAKQRREEKRHELDDEYDKMMAEDKREEARIENQDYKDECREEKIDW